MNADNKNEISEWWSNNAQTYGNIHGKTQYQESDVSIGSLEFFKKADQTFFDWSRPLHDKQPFDRIFPFERFKGKRVLEIGCGMGTMSSLWARNGAIITAVDLAPFSVEMTRRRFSLMELTGEIEQADGRALPFKCGEFDYVYSWGVLHHSPDLALSLSEMMRVLKPGGEFLLWLYNRHSLRWFWRILYKEGFLHNESDFLNPIELSSRYTDGEEAEGNPHTWPVTRSEVYALLGPYISSSDIRFCLTGEKEMHSLLESMLPAVHRLVPRWALKPWARRFGWGLLCTGTRFVGV